MNRQTKRIFVFLAFLLILGVGLIITACIKEKSGIPAIIFPFMLLSPLPVMMAANCASDGLFSTEKSGPAIEFGFFLTGILLTSVFALPVVLMVSGKMAQYSAALSIGGAISVMASIFVYQVIFNSSSDDE